MGRRPKTGTSSIKSDLAGKIPNTRDDWTRRTMTAFLWNLGEGGQIWGKEQAHQDGSGDKHIPMTQRPRTKIPDGRNFHDFSKFRETINTTWNHSELYGVLLQLNESLHNALLLLFFLFAYLLLN